MSPSPVAGPLQASFLHLSSRSWPLLVWTSPFLRLGRERPLAGLWGELGFVVWDVHTCIPVALCRVTQLVGREGGEERLPFPGFPHPYSWSLRVLTSQIHGSRVVRKEHLSNRRTDEFCLCLAWLIISKYVNKGNMPLFVFLTWTPHMWGVRLC